MFEIKKHKTFKNLHVIVDNRYVFYNDGENDILYTGTNIFGHRILGAIVFEDDEKDYLRYFHTLVPDKQYNDFINRQISLRHILKENESFFSIDFDYHGKELDYNLVFFDDLPNEFLPSENSICPQFISSSLLDFTFSLKGGISDEHRANPETMSNLNNRFCKVLKQSSEFVNELDIQPLVFSEPAMTGSFELRFKVVLAQPQLNLFAKPSQDINSFISKFFNYIFDKLPSERPNFLKEAVIASDNFKTLEKEYSDIHSQRGIELTNEVKEQKIIDLITYSVDNFKDLEYNGFNAIEVKHKTIEGIELPIALIEKNYYETIEDKVFKPEELNKAAVITIDESPQPYSVQVYSLNKESGNGSVYFTDKKGGISRVSLHLRGRNDYTNTVFAKNINEEIPIKIQGIGKRVDGKLKEITINL